MYIYTKKMVVTDQSDGLLANEIHSITITVSWFGERLISFGQKVLKRRWPWLINYRARDQNLTNTNPVASKS